jgi:hypothetical protein
MPIIGSNAYALCTLRSISAGESITVKYTDDKSYFGGQACGCATCNPSLPPIAKRRKIDETLFPENPNKKKRRGGKRERRRRKMGGISRDGDVFEGCVGDDFDCAGLISSSEAGGCNTKMC